MVDHLKPILDQLANQRNACELAKASFQTVKFLDSVVESLRRNRDFGGADQLRATLLIPQVLALAPYASFLVECYPQEFVKFSMEQQKKGNIK